MFTCETCNKIFDDRNEFVKHMDICDDDILSVTSEFIRDKPKKNKENWNKKWENEFKKPILDQFNQQSHPLYASARLWDDGIIDPTKTRDILATSLKISLNKKIEDTKFGIFRM